MTTVRLSLRESQGVHELADEGSLFAASSKLGTGQMTVKGYRDAACRKLCSTELSTAVLVAAGYDAGPLDIPRNDGAAAVVLNSEERNRCRC